MSFMHTMCKSGKRRYEAVNVTVHRPSHCTRLGTQPAHTSTHTTLDTSSFILGRGLLQFWQSNSFGSPIHSVYNSPTAVPVGFLTVSDSVRQFRQSDSSDSPTVRQLSDSSDSFPTVPMGREQGCQSDSSPTVRQPSDSRPTVRQSDSPTVVRQCPTVRQHVRQFRQFRQPGLSPLSPPRTPRGEGRPLFALRPCG